MFVVSRIHERGAPRVRRRRERGRVVQKERNKKVRKIQAEGPPEVAVTATAELV